MIKENLYVHFTNHVLKQKEYIIMLCIKDLRNLENNIDELYEMGIISLYYAYKLYDAQVFNHKNFDYVAYRFIFQVMQDFLVRETNNLL